MVDKVVQATAEKKDLYEKMRDARWGASKLRPIKFFSRFTDAELSDLYTVGQIRQIAPGTSVVIEAEPSRGIYVLLSGVVSVHKRINIEGQMQRLALLSEGSFFGELSLFDDAPRSATVIAEKECFLFFMDHVEFAEYLKNKGVELRLRFYQTCAEELAVRFRVLNSEYVASQQLLWRHALQLPSDVVNESNTKTSFNEIKNAS